MLIKAIRSLFSLFVVSVVLSACGGGGDSTGAGEATIGPKGGIWRGTDSNGSQYIGIVTETGKFHFISTGDGTQYYGTLAAASGSTYISNFQGVTRNGYVFLDGSNTGTGTYTGTINSRVSMNGSSIFTTSKGNSTNSTLNFTYNSIYDIPSSLSRISGNYQDVGGVVNISGGQIFEQNTSTGCFINGTVAIINASYNAYDVQYTFSGCFGSYAYLNGTTSTGVAMIDTSVSPERAYIAVVNYSARYSLIQSFPRIN